MTAFIIFLILCVIVYFIAFSSRDKTQDYKLTANYTNLPAEKKLIIDTHSAIQKKVNIATGLSTVRGTERIVIKGAIEEYRRNVANNIYDIARQYRIDPIVALALFNKCCDDALQEYL